MLLLPEKSKDAYDRLLEYAASVDLPHHIFATADTDSLASVRILTTLLQTHNVRYDVSPVTGYAQLIAAATAVLDGKTEPVSLVLVNCGGSVDVDELFDLPPDSIVHIFDSHRPYHLNNVYLDEGIYLLDDGSTGPEDIPSFHTYKTLLNDGLPDGYGETEMYSDGEYSDDGAYDEDESVGVGAVRRRSDEGGGRGRRKRRKHIVPPQQLSVIEVAEARERAMDARRIIEKYYASAYFGSAAAGLMYSLAMEIDHNTSYLLWLAILGITDQFIHERIDEETYEHHIDLYNRNVDELEDVSGQNTEGSGSVAHYKITRINEYRFMLFRHWTLYDSMFHSPYVAARLGIWQEPGRAKLQTMLAKMGLRLSDAKQKYALMSRDAKQILETRIHAAADEYGLPNIAFTSFQLKHIYSLPLSASDVVYATSALLEAPSSTAGFTEDENEAHIETEVGTLAAVRNKPGLHTNFWRAYDALHIQNEALLKRGLVASIEVQRALIRQGISLIENRDIVPTGPFRHAIISDSSPDIEYFVNPLTLTKLANFIVDVLRESRKARKPFVLAAYNKETDSYLAVGVAGTGQFGTVTKNVFGSAFQVAADATNAVADFDYWENSFVDIKREHMNDFMDHLHEQLTIK